MSEDGNEEPVGTGAYDDVGKDPESLHGIPKPDFHFAVSDEYCLLVVQGLFQWFLK